MRIRTERGIVPGRRDPLVISSLVPKRQLYRLRSKAAQPLPKAPTLTVPGDKSNPSVPKIGTTGATGPGTSTAATTNTLPATTTQANPSTPQGGAAPPSTGGASPDTQQNNTSPPAGSPAQKFEQF